MFNLFSFFKAGQSLLGMNARNLTYIRPHNLKGAKSLADDKIRSKKLLRKAGVPVPKLLARITTHEELDTFDWSQLPHSFVLKPNNGLGGAGIVIVYARKKGRDDAWIKSNGSLVTIHDLKNHISHIIDGAFSLTNSHDTAFFEERLQLSKTFRPYSYRGIPDIRIIIYNKVPVMAMLRLPTKSSDGKANLQQGGVGVGIDIATGTTTTAVQGKSKIIEYIPGSRLLLRGIKIPYWDDILKLSIKAQEASKLGFLGADVAIDREKGPVFLELNARPGLSIQVANMAGLKKRLERIEGIKIKSVARGVAVGKSLFGGEIEQELEETSGKKVIGSIEKVTLIGKNDATIEVEAKIDTGAYSTSIDESLARDLGFTDLINHWNTLNLSHHILKPGEETSLKKKILKEYQDGFNDLEDISVIFSSSGSSIRPVVRIFIILDGRKIPAKVNIVNRENLKYPTIIGKRNLHRFLVDVSK